jgi:plastocyanin
MTARIPVQRRTMTRPSLSLILSLCATLSVACRSDRVLEPQSFEPPLKISITANEFGGWSASTVLVKAGGAVTWVVPHGVPITAIWLNPYQPDEETLNLINGSVTRTFPTRGHFYFCADYFCYNDVEDRADIAFSVQVY